MAIGPVPLTLAHLCLGLGVNVYPLRTTAKSSAAEALAELTHSSTAPSAPLL